jgi:hypothetical protein
VVCDFVNIFYVECLGFAKVIFLFFGLAICDRQLIKERVCEALASASASQTLSLMMEWGNVRLVQSPG